MPLLPRLSLPAASCVHWKVRMCFGKSSWMKPSNGQKCEEKPGLPDLPDLHGAIDGQLGVAYPGPFEGGRMLRSHLKIASRAVQIVGIAVPLFPAHRQRAGRDQLIERQALAVQRHAPAFRLRNQQQVAAHASQADRLCGGSSLVRCRHLPQKIHIDPAPDTHRNQQSCKCTHAPIVSPASPSHKLFDAPGVFGYNTPPISLAYPSATRPLTPSVSTTGRSASTASREVCRRQAKLHSTFSATSLPPVRISPCTASRRTT